MAGRQNGGNIRQYRRPLNINLGMLIFLAIFLYIIICVGLYLFRDEKVVAYRVQEGFLSADNVYTGIALRSETVVSSEYAGYINYYAREGERVGSGQLVCTVDGSGQLKELLDEQNADDASLQEADLRELRTAISGFCAGFSQNSFDSVYNFKYELEGTVLKLANINVLENLSQINSAAGGQSVNLCYAPESGIITYSVDGFEQKTAAELVPEDFDEEAHEKTQLISNELAGVSDPLYRLATSEDWSVVIRVDRTTAAELEESEYVKVRFLKNRYESWGEVSIIDNGGDGEVLAELSFNNSMVSFATSRYLDIELLADAESGLKVPLSAITTKEFFLVPKAYVTKGGSSGSTGVLREAAGENGELTSEFVGTQIYQETDEYYYLDDSSLRVGDHLIMPDSTETFTVSQSASLTGVYNINKGYADFKEIQILQQNEEYAIIKSNTTYGLSTYDYIVLDASTVDADQLIHD
ncbi:MAG: HlyD family efflux transporter periplasmic adaptor subunit [Eubacteriales bacterium]|nr:HlyD family efflux transporter periplasmic adaptor subunit [Eubacteriales bacterium]